MDKKMAKNVGIKVAQNYTWRFAVFLICCQQTAKIIDLLLANRQQTAKNIPYEKVSFIEKIL